MADHTPGPWMAYPRHCDNDGTQDQMAGLGWDIEGPLEPQLRGQFAKAGDGGQAILSPLLYWRQWKWWKI